MSYLAYARVLHVDRYPQADTGAVVRHSEMSLAADGPITASVAAGRGATTILLSNPVSDDGPGRDVLKALRVAGVHQVPMHPAAETAHLTVIADRRGTRTWYAEPGPALHELDGLDLTPISNARLAYIDGYSILAPTAARAIQTAAAHDVPVLLNLGNDQPDPAIIAAARTATVYAVQTGLPQSQTDHVDTLADSLMSMFRPDAAIITLGDKGARARSAHGTHLVRAETVPTRSTHGAGAAFSAGLALAYLDGLGLPDALRLACHTGTEHCTLPCDFSPEVTPQKGLVQ
ncbi:carbohydrate kinase family protein [Streptomyces flavofungini]|uniref:Carbohydrate kinase family protein n=1 Tax=Streptomyces flavofungini TaxID=68200 RepID=A0ABS0XGK5_9ACTN|nr:carbohydrate kinase family protein [Streptomyces flavofungini]MBJ3812349.1 carbohydrate kinase family protein [Streptomyces flavofungini]